MVRRVRLYSGLVLFAYVTTHLLNHAVGLVSLRAAETGLEWFQAFWRNPVVGVLLAASLLAHVVLALWSLYQRRHLRMPAWEILRLCLGLAIPVLLIPHVIGTRAQDALFEADNNYTTIVLQYWVLDPRAGVQQMVLLVVAWVHGWLGVYHWARMWPGRFGVLPALRVVGLLLPVLSLLGFAGMGREVSARAADPAWVRGVLPPLSAAQLAVLDRLQTTALLVFLGALALRLLARPLRTAWQRRHGLVRVTYPDGRRVAIVPGTTVLEASRAGGIPHASLCGGRARCSTCRSRIGTGLEQLPNPADEEVRVLRRVNAAPNVRLACQVRPIADVDVCPLLPPVAELPADMLRPGQTSGVEREIAVLFADMRSFTRFAENRLPYDVVFLLNQYAEAMGRAIEGAGGMVNQFVGDGIMSLFGVETTADVGCREALQGAVAMARALESLNATLASDLREPLRIGIGIHAGHVIVGEMGYGRAR